MFRVSLVSGSFFILHPEPTKTTTCSANRREERLKGCQRPGAKHCWSCAKSYQNMCLTEKVVALKLLN